MQAKIQIRMDRDEQTYWKQVAATLMIAGVLDYATVAGLLRYGLALVQEAHRPELASLEAAKMGEWHNKEEAQ